MLRFLFPEYNRVVALRGAARTRACVLLLIPSLAGCIASSMRHPAVESRLTAEPTAARVGEKIRIAVTFTNPEPDTLVLEFGGACRVQFDVRSDGHPVLHPQSPETPCLVPSGDRVVLSGGSSWTVRHEWDGKQADGTPLLAGSYLLVAQLTDHVAIVRGKRIHKFPAGDTLRVQLLPPLSQESRSLTR